MDKYRPGILRTTKRTHLVLPHLIQFPQTQLDGNYQPIDSQPLLLQIKTLGVMSIGSFVKVLPRKKC